ncbi:unnamed protein product, partial [Ectocarpus fasciculatus]
MSSGDRAALVALFRSTGGTRWRQKKSWDTDADLSQWHGVEVNDDGRVVGLYLLFNKLKGPIPEALGALKELTNLILEHNKLTGSIPTSLRSLTKLELLGLGNNQLVGTIPEALGALTELKVLQLYGNDLTGPLPKALGALTELKELYLYRNRLTGSIPAWLGSLKNLNVLGLDWNQLGGRVPNALRALQELTHLGLAHNKLTGSIPAWLGSLGKLESLGLNCNQLAAGPIPEALGALTELSMLYLDDNKLTGHVPKELGNLENLRTLRLQNNQLTGTIPEELGNLTALRIAQFASSDWHNGNTLSGGPAVGEKLDSWRQRLKRPQETLKGSQKEELKGSHKDKNTPVPSLLTPPVLLPQQRETGEGEGEPNEEDAPLPLGSPDQRHETVGERARSPERASWSAEKAEVDELFRAQLLSSAGLGSLIRENSEALEDVQHVIEEIVAGQFSPGDECSGLERCRELGTFVAMSTALGEVVLKHTEDSDVKRKELALPTFWREYFTTVRSGLCKAYLAASVIDSDWVSTSKTGGMGKVGVALKLMSSAVPLVGGLPELAGKALETGDHYLQTRRLVKITALAPDAMECCSLARRLALELADGLRSDSSATADDTDQVRVDTTAGMKGGSGSRQGADMLPGDMSEEGVFDYLLEEVASYESNDHGGSRLGKQHLRKLLKAVQRGCLDGSTCIEEKIKALLAEILPEAHITPAAMSSTPKEVILRSPPVVAPAHDSELPSRAEFAGMQAALEVLTCAKDKQQEELEAIKLDKEKQQEELKAMGSANKMLQYKV